MAEPIAVWAAWEPHYRQRLMAACAASAGEASRCEKEPLASIAARAGLAPAASHLQACLGAIGAPQAAKSINAFHPAQVWLLRQPSGTLHRG